MSITCDVCGKSDHNGNWHRRYIPDTRKEETVVDAEPSGAPNGLASCPHCGAGWRDHELMSAAQTGGGYRVHCHVCDAEWDDPHASHWARMEARHADARTMTAKEAVDLLTPFVRDYDEAPHIVATLDEALTAFGVHP